jgi:hypothetical protein
MDTSLPPLSTGPRNNLLALASGILGLASIAVSLLGLLASLLLPMAFLVFCGLSLLMNLVALVLGIIGLVQLKSHPEQKGKGLAITGIVFGALSLILLCLLPVLGTAILAILGPVVGNVFTEISNTLVVP